jgi:hypothetical protein
MAKKGLVDEEGSVCRGNIILEVAHTFLLSSYLVTHLPSACRADSISIKTVQYLHHREQKDCEREIRKSA